MIAVERTGVFLPSKLAGELAVAGIPVAGVTCREEGDPSVVVAVQIILGLDPETEKADEAVIDAVCAAHDPVPAEVAAAPPAPQDAVLGALDQLDPATATVADVIQAVKGALVGADAVPVAPRPPSLTA